MPLTARAVLRRRLGFALPAQYRVGIGLHDVLGLRQGRGVLDERTGYQRDVRAESAQRAPACAE